MRQAAIYIPHGGGPCFFLNPDGTAPPMWWAMRDFLAGLVATLPERPKAILLASGHWMESRFTVNTGTQPALLFDYYNFPPHTYDLRWDAPGAPDVARRAAALLGAAGFATAEEPDRGWDHGVFVPLKVVLPDADIPVAQISLLGPPRGQEYDAQRHLEAGRALAPLRDEGVLIVGSGMSFHNMRLIHGNSQESADIFDAALSAVVTDPDPEKCWNGLANWSELPQAHTAHPHSAEEHLIPLMMVAGAGNGDVGQHIFRDQVIGWTVSAFRFG